ncbi:hypothetical protein FM106_31875 [Brachybacterium faecium]|nr:hypothetical protein FM106_31875 [Brachybacterium faecium]
MNRKFVWNYRENICFSKIWCLKQLVKSVLSICYFGTLTYTPSRCI